VAVRKVLIAVKSKVIGMRSMMCFPPMLTMVLRFVAMDRRNSMVIICSLVLPCKTISWLESHGLDKSPIVMGEVC
jgi:hypothetical protein